MTRKQERELREAQAVVALVDDVLENWGILMHYRDDDEREPGERFAAQVGDDEAVEHGEVYALICDVALEVRKRATADPILERALATATDAEIQSVRDKAEIERLRTIIEQAYSSQGWDIGSMKNLLIPGLKGYENSGWAQRAMELDSYQQAAREIARFSE